MDAQLFVFLHNTLAHRAAATDAAIIFTAKYLPYLLVLLLLGVAAFSRRTLKEKVAMAGVPILSALIARLGATNAIRYFYHRPRPFQTLDVQNLIPDPNLSFPSGHASFFFAMAAALYFYDRTWGIAFLCMAALVSIARIAAGVHYPSDILGGAAVGVAVAFGVQRVSQSMRPTLR